MYAEPVFSQINIIYYPIKFWAFDFYYLHSSNFSVLEMDDQLLGHFNEILIVGY